MKPHLSMITLGVRDLNGAKRFYGEGLGWPVLHEQPGTWVCFGLADGSTALAISPWDALAGTAGVAPDGGGFGGIALSYIVRSEDRVETVLEEARRAGARILRPAQRTGWGGASGVFADPDGHVWQVAGPAAEHFIAE